mgnify:CR=1 FL=1
MSRLVLSTAKPNAIAPIQTTVEVPDAGPERPGLLGFAVLSPTCALRGRLTSSPFNLATLVLSNPRFSSWPPKNKNPPDGGFLFFWLGDQDSNLG